MIEMDERSGICSRHFSIQLLYRYFCQPRTLDSSLSTEIAEHLKDCPECAADLDLLKNSDVDPLELVLFCRKGTTRGLFYRLLDNLKG